MKTQQILHWLHNLYKGTESAVKTEKEGSTCPISLVLNLAGLSKHNAESVNVPKMKKRTEIGVI